MTDMLQQVLNLMKGEVAMSSPAATVTWDSIKRIIINVQNDPNLGRGKISKIDHLTDQLFIMFSDAGKAVDQSVVTKEVPLTLQK